MKQEDYIGIVVGTLLGLRILLWWLRSGKRLNADGGAAMTAYARMQFMDMTNEEVERISSSLLKYCELDTLAMVMIYQHWANEIGWKIGKRAA